ncbi:MAG: PAS domain-containing protein, partial [Candidatus Hydrogenedentes bacterium]|nr:PAS domain-containing protein [Candidatus Hydrogenedentota bacterium]
MLGSQAAQQLVEFLRDARDELEQVLLQGVPPELLRGVRRYIGDWLESQLDALGGRGGRTSEWVSLLLQWAKRTHQPIELILEIAQVSRDRFAEFARRCPGISEEEATQLTLALYDEHLRHILAFALQQERDLLSADRRRQRAVAESLDCAFAMLDSEGRIEYVNSECASMLGMPFESLLGDELLNHLDQVAAESLRRALRRRRSAASLRFTGAVLSGKSQHIPVRFAVTAVYDSQGLRSGLTVCMYNLTEQAVSATDGQYQAFHALAEVLRVSFLVVNPDRRVLDSAIIQPLASLTRTATAPYCCRLLATQPGSPACACRQVCQTGKPYQRLIHSREGASTRWFNFVVIPLHSAHDTVLQVFCLIDEVSDVKALEKRILEQQRSSFASQLAVTVAHQLRNPLGVIIGFSEMLSSGMPPDQAAAATEKILRNGLRCREIVQALLEFGQAHPRERTMMDVCDLIRDLVLPAYAAPARQRIECHLPKSAGLVDCLPHQLAQVFCSLIDNALHHGPEDAPISVSVEPARDAVRVSVRDEGPGVSEELAQRIFQPFFTTEKNSGAVGLGLALSHTVVLEHGGRLYLSETGGPGATFRVELPLSQKPVLPDAAGTGAVASGRRRKRVLIVDDELDLLEMLETVMTVEGYDVTTSPSGE